MLCKVTNAEAGMTMTFSVQETLIHKIDRELVFRPLTLTLQFFFLFLKLLFITSKTYTFFCLSHVTALLLQFNEISRKKPGASIHNFQSWHTLKPLLTKSLIRKKKYQSVNTVLLYKASSQSLKLRLQSIRGLNDH